MKGIHFIEPLFHKVVDGSKTQTRRIMKAGTPLGNWEETAKHARYKVGETVYLKEPYYDFDGEVFYRYSDTKNFNVALMEMDKKWQNKLFMPEKYARYFIEITGVRCERLQDISNEDCLKEGIVKYAFCCYNWINKKENGCDMGYINARSAYAVLIDEISGRGTWDGNPLVFVYDFKLIK